MVGITARLTWWLSGAFVTKHHRNKIVNRFAIRRLGATMTKSMAPAGAVSSHSVATTSEGDVLTPDIAELAPFSKGNARDGPRIKCRGSAGAMPSSVRHL